MGQAVVTQCVIVDELGKRVLTHKALAATQNGVEEEAQCKVLVLERVEQAHAYRWIGLTDDAAVLLVNLAIIVDIYNAVVTWVIALGDIVAYLPDAIDGVVVDSRVTRQ